MTNHRSADTTAPIFIRAATNASGSKIILTYSESLSVTTAAKTAFSVKVAGTTATIRNVVVNGSTIELILVTPVRNGQTVAVGYTAPVRSTLITNAAIQDLTGNDAIALPGTTAVTNRVADTVPPTFISAATNISGNKIILTYTEALSATTAAKTAFAIQIAGIATPIDSVAVRGRTVELTLARVVENGQSVTVGYTAPTPSASTTNAAIQDNAGNDAITLATTTNVTNRVADTNLPTFVSAATSANGSKVILTYNETLSTTTAAKTAFIVKVAGTSVAVNNVAVSGSTVQLTLATAVGHNQTVTVGYTAPTASTSAVNFAIQDVAGNDAVTLIPTTTVSNTVDNVPPVTPILNGAVTGESVLPQVTFRTTLGTFVVALLPEYAPITVANMLAYVNDGFYNNTIFHRVIANFVAQGGGFTSGLNYKTPTYTSIFLESHNGISNMQGTLAMARTSEPNSATDQFYINLANNSFLDYANDSSPGYTVFGFITTTAGVAVVNAMARVTTATVSGYTDVPITDITILSATQTTQGIVFSNTGLMVVSNLEANSSWSYSINGGNSWITGTGISFYLPEGSYSVGKLLIRQIDQAGNRSVTDRVYPSELIVDKTAPTVSTFSPADEATSVSFSGTIRIVFNEKVQKGTGDITLKMLDGSTVETFDISRSTQINLSDDTLIITPISHFFPGTTYNVVLNSGTLVDLAGNKLAEVTNYNFTTVDDTTRTSMTRANYAITDTSIHDRSSSELVKNVSFDENDISLIGVLHGSVNGDWVG